MNDLYLIINFYSENKFRRNKLEDKTQKQQIFLKTK